MTLEGVKGCLNLLECDVKRNKDNGELVWGREFSIGADRTFEVCSRCYHEFVAGSLLKLPENTTVHLIGPGQVFYGAEQPIDVDIQLKKGCDPYWEDMKEIASVVREAANLAKEKHYVCTSEYLRGLADALEVRHEIPALKELA